MPVTFSEALARRQAGSGSSRPSGSTLGGGFSAGFTAPAAATVGGGPDPVTSIIQGIVRLKAAGENDQADELLKKYGPELPEASLRQYNLTVPKSGGGGGIFDKLKRVGTGALSTGLDYLNRPGQASLEALQAVGQTAGFNTAPGGQGGYGDILAAFSGTQDHTLNLREAIGGDPQSGGLLAGAIDILGSAVLDPATYASFGTSAVAKIGLKAVEEVGGRKLATLIAKEGTKALAPEARIVLRESLLNSAKGTLAKKGAEKYADDTLRALDRAAQGGIKFGGHTVISGESILKARVGLGLSDETAAVTRKVLGAPGRAVGKVLEKPMVWATHAFISGREVSQALGTRVANEVKDAFSTAQAHKGSLVADTIARTEKIAKESGLSGDDFRGRILKALETEGGVPAEAALLRAEGRESAAQGLESLAQVRTDFTDSIIKAKLAEPGSVLQGVRESRYQEVLAKAASRAEKPVAAAVKSAETAGVRAERAAAALAAARTDIQSSLEGAGRNLTDAEVGRLAVKADRATSAIRNSTKVEAALESAVKDAPKIREAAFNQAVDDAMKGLPAARATKEAARSRAEKAAGELAAHQSKLSVIVEESGKITTAQIRRLGKLEGRSQLFESLATKAERAGAAVEAQTATALKKVGEKATAAASTEPLAKAATRARKEAELAQKDLAVTTEKITAKAGEADARLGYGHGKLLGALETRARVTANIAKSAETRASRIEARTKAFLEGPAVKTAEREAELQVKAYARSHPVLRNIETYVERSATPTGAKLLAEVSPDYAKVLEALHKPSGLSALRQGGTLKSRVLHPEVAHITDLNSLLADQLKKDGVKFFEDNSLVLTTKRAILAHEAVAEAQYITDMANILDDAGNAVVMVGKETAAEAKKLGYTSISSKYMKDVYAHPSIAKEIERTSAVVFSDLATKNWENFVDKWGSLWAGYATTPVIFGTGFFARNAMGNVFNNTLAGDIYFNHYLTASKAQLGLAKAVKETGRSLGPEFEAALQKNLGKRLAGQILSAREHGVLSAGFFSVDNASDALRHLSEKEGGKLAKINPLNKENILLKPGQELNGAIEANARLAHYIAKVDKYGDEVSAARSVKKYLFDYGDLTAFEKTKMRRFIRFYTYMRKNTPLMFSELAHNPGKFTALAHVQQGIANAGSSEGNLPQYGVNQGGVPFGGTLLSVDTPFSSALKAIEPFAQAIALVPGIKEILPKSLQNEEGFKGVARGIANVPSGGPIEIAKFFVSESTGKSLFTGADLKPGGIETWKRFGDALLPIYTKGNRTVRQVLNTDGRDQARLKLAASLAGINVIINDEKAQRGEAYRQLNLVKTALRNLQAEGVDVPTIGALRKAQIIPKLTRKKTRLTVPKSRRRRKKRRSLLP